MAKSKFSVNDLDQLLSDAIDSNELATIKDQLDNEELVPESQVSPAIANMVNQKTGQSVDFTRVYRQLEKLIQNGNVALQIIAAIDPDTSDGQIGTTTASLMNAIKNCVAEFTKIHLMHIKFQQAIQLENIRHQHKMEQLEKKQQIIAARNNNNGKNNTIDVEEQKGENGNVLVPWNTEQISQYMQYLNKQKQGV